MPTLRILTLLLLLLSFSAIAISIDSIESRPCKVVMSGISDEFKNQKHGDIHSVLISRNQNLVWEEYYKFQTESDLHTVQSVTKSISSLLFGIALSQGIIPSLDISVYDVFHDSYGAALSPDFKKVTLRHVLTMTAGLDWVEEGFKDTKAMNASSDWIRYVLEKKIVDQPGTKFYYNDGLSILLSGVVQKFSGMSLDRFAEKYLFGPLSIKNYQWVKQGVIAHAGGGLSLRSKDLLKIGQMILNEGIWNGKQVVDKKWLSVSTSPLVLADKPSSTWYGFQWWQNRGVFNGSIADIHYAWGCGSQFLFIVHQLKIVAVFTGRNLDKKSSLPLQWMAEILRCEPQTTWF